MRLFPSKTDMYVRLTIAAVCGFFYIAAVVKERQLDREFEEEYGCTFEEYMRRISTSD